MLPVVGALRVKLIGLGTRDSGRILGSAGSQHGSLCHIISALQAGALRPISVNVQRSRAVRLRSQRAAALRPTAWIGGEHAVLGVVGADGITVNRLITRDYCWVLGNTRPYAHRIHPLARRNIALLFQRAAAVAKARIIGRNAPAGQLTWRGGCISNACAILVLGNTRSLTQYRNAFCAHDG